MPIARLSFIRATLVMLLAGFAALALIVGTSIWLVDRTQAYAEAMVKSRALRGAAVDLLIAVQDAETGQRGYLLTGQDAYLRPYDAAMAEIGARAARLKAAVAALAAEAADVERLIALIDRKVAELGQTIELKKTGDGDAALALVRTDSGKQLMDEARAIFGSLISSAEARFNAALAEQRTSSQILWWITVGGGLIILVVTSAGASIILRYTRELMESRIEVQALATGLEERVAERTVDLVRANEEVQRFAYIVTHDLRAPLVNIMGFTSELETSIAEIQALIADIPAGAADAKLAEVRRVAEQDVPEALGFIRSSTRKMDALINAILKLSREGRRTMKPERLDLGALLQAASETIAHQLNESQGVIEIAAKAPLIVSDRLSLEQVIGNLLDNAVKYRSPDRPLVIRVGVEARPGNRVLIEIADNGRGIAEQDHQRVFELFRRSGVQDKPGEGIGLAYAQTLIRKLGGEIAVTSRLGQGTTFSINLPRDVSAFVGSRSA
ncbi:MAG TPA: CHASE3 domain-containing protein [Xanthobacteraceae bacterium]|nr:CHASE3 domain-containing protein [Xanthobacteraceae bacterium]